MKTVSRRGFIQTLAASAAAAAAYEVIDPERLLWVPGQKTIFMPPVKRFERADLIVSPNEYVDFEIDMNEAMYASEVKKGATFEGFDRVSVYGNDGSVTRVDLDRLQGRLLQADAKRHNARLNDWTRRTVEGA